MTHSFSKLLLIIIFIGSAVSCTKSDVAITTDSSPSRTIQFNLYTNKDFSTDNKMITFSVFIKDHSTKLFDSVLAPMKVNDVPAFVNKISFSKKISGYTTDLAAGFEYTIENVGYSWYLDTCKQGQSVKVIDFAFQ